jgi:hypothetical protein
MQWVNLVANSSYPINQLWFGGLGNSFVFYLVLIFPEVVNRENPCKIAFLQGWG